MAALIRKVPLEAEVALVPRRGVRRNDRYKEYAVADLAPDPLIPHVPAAQLALVEPHFNPGLAQHAADAGRCRGILRGVAEEYGGRVYARLILAAALDHFQYPHYLRAIVADAQGVGNQTEFRARA